MKKILLTIPDDIYSLLQEIQNEEYQTSCTKAILDAIVFKHRFRMTTSNIIINNQQPQPQPQTTQPEQEIELSPEEQTINYIKTFLKKPYDINPILEKYGMTDLWDMQCILAMIDDNEVKKNSIIDLDKFIEDNFIKK